MKTFRYLLAVFVLIFCFGYVIVSFKDNTYSDVVLKDGLIIFTQKSCGHCHTAKAFLESKIKPTYPDLIIREFDIADEKNFDLMRKYASVYGLDMKRLGTPLIFLGDESFIGWGPGMPYKLEKAVLSFQGLKNQTSAAADQTDSIVISD